MIAKAIEKIISISGPHIINTAQGSYSDQRLVRIKDDMTAEPIEVRSISALVAYIRDVANAIDGINVKSYFVQVVSPTEIKLLSGLNRDRERECIMVARPELPRIPFGQFIDSENMIIALQSMFMDDNDTKEILAFVGTATAGTIKEYDDNGVSQVATVRSGARGKENKIVPSPCTLCPIRTFTEIKQPASKFIFRLKDGNGDTVQAALFEADGGAWRIEAMREIADYLQEQLSDIGMQIIG